MDDPENTDRRPSRQSVILWAIGVVALVLSVWILIEPSKPPGESGQTRPMLADLNAPDRLTLYSIEGGADCLRNDVKTKPTGEFHRFPVIGKVEIKDPEQRRQLIAALKDAHARRPEQGPKCFCPRHGIRAVEKGQTIDLVICFQCFRFEEYIGEMRMSGRLLNRDIQPVFDKPLTDAGIEIAPE